MPYAYERGDHRRKHCWDKPYPGFEPGGRGEVGKCPSTLDDAAAQGLLDEGVEFRLEEGSPHPDAIFAVHEGVPYLADATQPGVSFHGYPWRWRGRPMPARIREELERRASASGHGRAFAKWMKAYGAGT